MTDINRRNFLKTAMLAGSSITLGSSLLGCDWDSSDNATSPTSMRFAVLSDPHVYDSSLGTTGSAFDSYLAEDRKMLLQSSEILESIVSRLLAESDLDALIIPGDLTKDGELVCHQKAIEILQPLRDAGVAVFVVPGNHDINNPHAVAFDGDSTTSVATVDAEQFAELYADFGYAAAIYRDENSLSYIAEPVPGVWLVALDSCKYADNLAEGSPNTTGQLTDDQLGWLAPLLEQAKAQRKVVFGMMHHGVVAHFDSQPSFFAEYLVDDYQTVGEMLASYGLNLMFTGHFHAQDVAAVDYQGDGSMMMYDVETGSTVTSPCPYRLIELDITAARFAISSEFVNRIASVPDFVSYKENFINEGMLTLYTSYLSGLGLSGVNLNTFAGLATSLHVAHYKGDEDTNETVLSTLQALAASDDPQTAYLGSALYSLAVDPGLPDNDLAVSLASDELAMVKLFRRIMLA